MYPIVCIDCTFQVPGLWIYMLAFSLLHCCLIDITHMWLPCALSHTLDLFYNLFHQYYVKKILKFELYCFLLEISCFLPIHDIFPCFVCFVGKDEKLNDSIDDDDCFDEQIYLTNFCSFKLFHLFLWKKLNIFKHKMNICVPLKLLRWQDIASNFFTLSGEGHAPIHP